jgi:hypothetical protein
MKSVNHQFPEFSDKVIARYIKSIMTPLSGYRLNPRNAVNPNDRIEFLLTTDEADIEITPYNDGENTKHKQIRFSYDNEVLELYTQLEVAAFERMNKLLIENGILIPYSESAPEIDKTNVINARDLKALSKASPDVLREKLSVITSVQVLEKLLETMENTDTTTMAQIKVVKARLNEFNKR